MADLFLAGESIEVGCQLPLVAIPTTAGSGAEATHFAVVYVDGVKKSASHVSLRPTVAVVDPQLTAQLPATIAAHSGLAALCQSIESIWSVGANEESLGYATEAAIAMKHYGFKNLNMKNSMNLKHQKLMKNMKK